MTSATPSLYYPEPMEIPSPALIIERDELMNELLFSILEGLSKERIEALKYLDEEQTKYLDSVPATEIIKKAPHGMATLVVLQEIEAKTGLVKSVMRYPMIAGTEEITDDGRVVDYNPDAGHLRYSIPDGDVRLWLRDKN